MAQDLLPDLDNLAQPDDQEVLILSIPAATPSVLFTGSSPAEKSAAVAFKRSITITLDSSTITLVFQGDIWVTDNKARTGYTLASVSNCLVMWDAHNDNLEGLNAARYKVVVSGVTGISIESFLI